MNVFFFFCFFFMKEMIDLTTDSVATGPRAYQALYGMRIVDVSDKSIHWLDNSFSLSQVDHWLHLVAYWRSLTLFCFVSYWSASRTVCPRRNGAMNYASAASRKISMCSTRKTKQLFYSIMTRYHPHAIFFCLSYSSEFIWTHSNWLIGWLHGYWLPSNGLTITGWMYYSLTGGSMLNPIRYPESDPFLT